MTYTREQATQYQQERRAAIKAGKKVKRRKPATLGSTRRCTQCKVFKELSFDFFYRSSTYSLGLQPRCKVCQNANVKRYYKQNL